ncbi:MAG: hypothetical protein JW821_02295 [Deltaproteobacteria bacterium]|nr:hypothetical protein [Deltaproteobacteria bacterium]
MRKNGPDISIGDIVLIHYQDRPTVYARIEAINPDVKRDWFQVSLLLLTIPSKPITWILRDEYIQGSSFTMGGQSMRLERVPSTMSKSPREQDETAQKSKGSAPNSKVIPFRRGD